MGVNDAHPFLLTGPRQEGAKDFEAIDVDEVFIEIPTANIVLRAHFVARTHPGKGLYNSFHTALSARGKPDVLTENGGPFFWSARALYVHFIQKSGVHDLRGGGPWQ
jgi:hypothetical protein